MKAKKFEQQFDEGDNLLASLDLSKARRVQRAQQKVNTNSERLEAGASKVPPQRTRASAAHR